MRKLLEERRWLVYAIVAGLAWGVWGVLAKFISANINAYTNHVLFSLGMLFTLPFVLPRCKRPELNRRGLVWGLVAGVLAIAGNVALYLSFGAGGQAATVIPITNLYPLATIIIALLVFKEKMHWLNGIGVLLVLPAITMLSGEALIFEDPAQYLATFALADWILYALVAMLFWGFFSAAQKVTTNHISAEWSYVAFVLASALLAIGFMAAGLVQYTFTNATLVAGPLSGAMNGLGVLAAYAAYRSEGKAALVTAVAGAMQPAFTIVLAIMFLRESIGLIECAGIALAILGSLFLSVEKKPAAAPLISNQTVQP
ncbi:DMT family transporter [Massilia glaciei]|uniref:EamA/RhaT family transporter n=1 Tax=Massilia glaciei TaxID=1524097 RepID=A0A2U2HDP9_9BURK|nr:DMT family transporter [Massilia glaciei]PWF41236.1 EamA/RhaT family transporter [Massilia glaciei]